MRRLVWLCFILQHPLYTFFQKDLFLEDLASGRERYRFWGPKKLTYQFMAEARRLWEIEMKSGEDRITTVQASMVLCAGYSTTGLDQLGADYLVQGTRMAERMQIFGSLDHVKNPFRCKVHAMTAWALFGYQGMFAFHMWQQPLLTEPPMESLADVGLSTEKHGEVWVKYPRSQSLTPVHFGESFVASSQLRAIMAQISLRARWRRD
ncbi:hypothetical protein ACHAQA_010170 [Verticillium albo-atrum]